MFLLFLSGYRNTRESLGELKGVVETQSKAARAPIAFPVLPLVFQ